MPIRPLTPPGIPAALRIFVRAVAVVATAAMALGLVLGLMPSAVRAQQALVVCPPGDAAGCERIVQALAQATRSATDPALAFPGGVHRHYESLRTMSVAELGRYAVVMVPSLANEPYALLREPAVGARLRAVLRGRVAVWSGTPDRGTAASSAAAKRALLQTLGRWAAAHHATTGATGLVALQDFSDATAVARSRAGDAAAGTVDPDAARQRPDVNASAGGTPRERAASEAPSTARSLRYAWLEGIAGVRVLPDTAVHTYGRITLGAADAAELTALGALAYDNMASFGLADPATLAGSADGLPVGRATAWGQSAAGARGQVVLVTLDRQHAPSAPVGPEGGALVIGGPVPVRLAVPAGAVDTNLVLSVAPAAAGDARVLVGSAFTLSPAGLHFAAPVQMTLSYAALILPADTDPAGLTVVRLDDATGAWLPVGTTTVDTTARTALVPITGTGTFALLAPPTRPAVAAITLEPPTATLALGESRTLTLTATAEDGRPVSGQGVTWQTSSGSTIAVVTTDTTDAAGQLLAAVTAVSGASGATYTVTATVGAHEASSVLTVVAGAAATIAVERGDGQTATAGTAVPVPPAVRVRDADGNPVAGATVTFAVTKGSGTLTDAIATSDSSGIAAVGGWTLGTAASPRSDSLSATVAGLPGVGFGAAATSGAAAQLAVGVQPAAAAASGAAFTTQPAVRLLDQYGNAVAQAGVSVTAAIATGGGTLGGTATALTDASGVATFTDLAITGAAGERTLSFSATGLGGATSGAIAIAAGPPAQLAIVTQPSATAQAGVAFAQQPIIQLRDADGNAAAQAGVTVTAAIDSGGGTLGGTVTATTDSSGTATFAGLSVGGAAGTRTLSFSATGLTGATSSGVSVTAGVAAALVISGQPSNVVAGAPITPAVQVSIVDAYGNVVTGATDTVTVAIGTNPAGGTLSGSATATAVSGVATFADLGIDRVGTGYTLAASAGALTGATSAGFDVTLGPLDHFLVEAAGGGAITSQQAGTPFNVRVTARDAFNNTVTGFTGTVGFTSTPSGGISAGATSGAFTAGVLSSHGVTFGTPGSFTLTATQTAGTESGTSNSFGVQGPPTAVNEAPTPTSAPGDPYHAVYSTSGSPQTFTLSAPGVTSNDNLGFPTATITSFGADSMGGNVTIFAAGTTVSPLPGMGRTTGSLTVNADGSITFTPPDGFTGNYVFRYRLTNVRGTSDARVTIAVGVRPAAVNDTYSPTLLGNVPINTAASTQFRVTENDVGDGKRLTISGQSNGTVTLNADGTFTFRPTPGYEGPASFSYTVRNGFATSSPATVSMTVSGMAWFIDAGAAAGGNGRRDAPFNSLAAFQAVNDGTGNNPAMSDRIFLHSGAYTGPVQLLSQQQLIGQGATGSFATATGLAWPDDGGTPPAVGGTRPTITASGANAVALNSVSGANTLRGFDVGNVGAAGTAIHGSSFGALTVSDVGINTNGRALSLTSGTLDGSFSEVRSTGGANNVYLSLVQTTAPVMLGTAADALSGATGDAFRIDGRNGAFTYAGSITNTGALAVNVANKDGGTVTLSGPINPAAAARGISVSGNSGGTTISFSGSTQRISSGAAAGVSLSGNTGATIDFTGGALEIATTTGSGFTATGGGTVTVTGAANTIASAGGVALDVASTTIGAGNLVFRSVSANGGTSGIALNGTGSSGRLQVTGTGTAGSGGTIQNTTAHGISLAGTNNPAFDRVNLQNTGGSGINGTAVTGFTLTNSTIANSGTAGGANDSNIDFYAGVAPGTEMNLSGAVTITGNILSTSHAHNVDIQNWNGTISDLTLSGNTLTNTSATGGQGIRVIALGEAGNVARITRATIDDNQLEGMPSGVGLQVQCGNASAGGPAGECGTEGSGTDVVAITNNRVWGQSAAVRIGAEGVLALLNGRGQANFDVSGNDVRHTTGRAMGVSVFGQGQMTATVSNNTIVANNGFAAAGLEISSDSTANMASFASYRATVTNNTISQTDGVGIHAIVRASSNALRVKLQGNTIAAPLSGVRPGLRVESGSATGNTLVCANITGNTSAGSGGTQGIGLRKQGTNSAINVFGIHAMAAATATPDVESYVAGMNPAGNGVLLLSAASGFGNCAFP